MSQDKQLLFDFLELLSDELRREITLVAVGGTAMTLLDLKSSTIDIDFTIPISDLQEYNRALKILQPGLRIDIWADGFVFTQILPDDYLEKSIEIKRFRKILLKALHPIDIVVTKIGRLNERDIQDIELCISKWGISKTQIETRAAEIQYVADEEVYAYNLQYVIENFF